MGQSTEELVPECKDSQLARSPHLTVLEAYDPIGLDNPSRKSGRGCAPDLLGRQGGRTSKVEPKR